MKGTTLNRVIEDFSQLPLEDKEYAADVIRKQLIEAKREAIHRRAREAMVNAKKGKIKTGTVRELHEGLESDGGSHPGMVKKKTRC